ncbi:MAG: hypothetical protein ABR582_01535 [Gemmatimonadaceae bacterium]
MAAPVQAEGIVGGRSFYFRARGDTWEFTVAERLGDDPAELSRDPDPEGRAWHREGTLPGRFAASWMPIDRAKELINECAREYLLGKKQNE